MNETKGERREKKRSKKKEMKKSGRGFVKSVENAIRKRYKKIKEKSNDEEQ